MFQKVLMAVKPGYSKLSSLGLVKVLAKQFDLDLLLYSSVNAAPGSTTGPGTAEALLNIEQSMLKSELQRLEDIKSHVEGLCNSVTLRADWQVPVAQGVTDAAVDFEADLIVLSGTTHGRLRRYFMPHTDWEVVRLAKVPVLVSQNPEPQAYARVLAAIDPTHRHDRHELLNKSVLEFGGMLSRQGQLFVGHVYPPREDSSIEACMPPIDEFESWQEYRKAAMQTLAEQHGIDPAHIGYATGTPAAGIIDLAKTLNCDLVVMGALSRTFGKERVLGTIAETVLNRIDCDVMFVPLKD